jgi:hypothetical protein
VAILRMVFQELSLGFPWQLPFFFGGMLCGGAARAGCLAGRAD